MLYSDGTCTYKDKTCKYQIEEVRNEEDELVPGISIDIVLVFISSLDDDRLVEPNEKTFAKYNG